MKQYLLILGSKIHPASLFPL